MLPFLCPTDHTIDFLNHVVPKPTRILEVGCGGGDVAKRLAQLGHTVVGIDTDADAIRHARAIGADVREANLLTFECGNEPFGAIVFTRSLHHIGSLRDAVSRAHALLAKGGLLIVEDFALDEINHATAVWLYDVESLLETAGVLRVDAEEARSSPGDALRRWQVEHAAGPRLHTSNAMSNAVRASFDVRRMEGAPYLYRYLIDRLESTERGYRVAREVFARETQRIHDGTIKAIGLRIVAVRK